MTKLLDIVPGFVWAIACAVLLVLSGTCYVRMKHAQTQLATYRAEVAENTRQAELEARNKERAMQRQVERIANDAAKKQAALTARAAAVESAARSLRDDIERLNAGAAPADAGAAAIVSEARTARELLGACADRYRGVAQAADELREQVTGLQDYATTICKAP